MDCGAVLWVQLYVSKTHILQLLDVAILPRFMVVAVCMGCKHFKFGIFLLRNNFSIDKRTKLYINHADPSAVKNVV